MNHFLAFHSLKPTPFEARLLLGRGLFLLRPTPLFFSTVFVCHAILLCHSCRGVILTLSLRASLGLLLILPLMTRYSHLSLFWLRWASLAHLLSLGPFGPFPSSAFPWALLTPLGFPGPLTLSFILVVHELSINPLFSLLSLLRACCGPFSLFYITYCPWVCFFSLSWLL